MVVSPYADTPATTAMLVDVSKLITAYYTEVPDPAVPEQRVVFGTSGHRGSALAPALLAAEIMAWMGRDPGEIYRDLTREFGEPVYDRVEAPATPEQKVQLERLSPQQVRLTTLAGESIQTILTHTPGNGAPIGGVKVVAEHGWFAARPSGMEPIYKLYAESFRGADHLHRILEEAQVIVSAAVAAAGQRGNGAA